VSEIACVNCLRPYSDQRVDYKCPDCGGIYDYSRPISFEPESIDDNQPGVWRYRSTFGLSTDTKPISLGEGNTPLVWDDVEGRKIAFKLEYLNPTGSYKDRGITVLISYLLSRGVKVAVEDSSGNAGASFAAYSARAGIKGIVFVPESASGPKCAQIEAYGVELIRVGGPRSKAAEAVKEEAEKGVVYASHIYQPFVLTGYATVAYEICTQMGDAPGAIFLPVGHGTLLLGMWRGFEALLNAGLISHLPIMIGVQARMCAPLWVKANYDLSGQSTVNGGETLAEGIRIRDPIRGDQVLNAVMSSQGLFTIVDEKDILPARNELALRGFYVEPTSAVVWPAVLEMINDIEAPIVTVLTGSGFKYSPT
jgi:threonine synthase